MIAKLCRVRSNVLQRFQTHIAQTAGIVRYLRVGLWGHHISLPSSGNDVGPTNPSCKGDITLWRPDCVLGDLQEKWLNIFFFLNCSHQFATARERIVYFHDNHCETDTCLMSHDWLRHSQRVIDNNWSQAFSCQRFKLKWFLYYLHFCTYF